MAEQDVALGLLSDGGDSGGDCIASSVRTKEKTDLLVYRIESDEYVFEEWSLDEGGQRARVVQAQR